MIFLVEDDAGIRELVIYALSNSGFPAQGFDTPSAFWQALAKQHIPAPAGHIEYLERMYGDYMQLPPEEDRQKGHSLMIARTVDD